MLWVSFESPNFFFDIHCRCSGCFSFSSFNVVVVVVVVVVVDAFFMSLKWHSADAVLTVVLMLFLLLLLATNTTVVATITPSTTITILVTLFQTLSSSFYCEKPELKLVLGVFGGGTSVLWPITLQIMGPQTPYWAGRWSKYLGCYIISFIWDL